MKRRTYHTLRPLVLLLALLLCLTALPACESKNPGGRKDPPVSPYLAEGDLNETIHWTLTPEGTLTVSGTGNMPDFNYTHTPWFSFNPAIKTIVVEEGITGIGRYSFHLCEQLTSVSLPESLKSIGLFAIRDCTSLTSITIPSGVETIDPHCLIGNRKLERIEVAYGNRNYTSRGNCLMDKNGTILQATLNTVIPTDTEIVIGEYSFYSFWDMNSMTIPENVTSIGRYAFGATGLQHVVIPAGITEISPYAFYECTQLEDIVLPEGLLSIGEQAFAANNSLGDITIPGSVTSIAKNAFFAIRNLSDIYYGNTRDAWVATGVDTDHWQVQTDVITVHCTDGDIVTNNADPAE